MSDKNEIFYYLDIKTIKKYLRANYDVDFFPHPFYDISIFTGAHKLDKPLFIGRDRIFGTTISDIIPTTLSIRYLISKNLLRLLLENKFTGFVPFDVISDDIVLIIILLVFQLLGE